MSNVSGIIKSIQDIMRKDVGVDGDAQRISQLVWMFFLKIYDDREEEIELLEDDYKSPLPEHLRWRNWAADPEGMTGEGLSDFINLQLFPTLKEKLDLTGPRALVIRNIFEDAYNYMKSGQLMKQVINKISKVDFNSLTERQHFGDIYEQLLNDLQSAGNAGEYYTPRAVTAFMAERVLGNVISSGIKVLVLAVIIGIGSTLFAQFTAGFGGVTPTIDEAMAVVLAALSLLGLGIFGPGIANGLVSGGPQLGAGSAIGTGLAAGGAAVAGVGSAGLAARGGALALSGTAAAARGGAAIAGGASTAYSLGSAGQSGAAGVASGLGAVASAGARAAASPLKRLQSKASGSIQASHRSGLRTAFDATGGTIGNTGGSDASSAAPAPASSPAADGPPAWARRMKRSQQLSHGVSAAAHAVRSGDSHGGGASINLQTSDRT